MTGIYFFFYYYKYHRHYYRIYYYHFLFYPEWTFFFPRVTICFLGGFFSKKNLASKVIAHLKRVELLMLNSALSNFISRSLRFFSNSVSFTVFEWVSVRSRLVIKLSLSLPIQKSLQVASGMVWQTRNIVNQNVFMNNSISTL